MERQQLARRQLVDVADLQRPRLRHRRGRRQGLRRRHLPERGGQRERRLPRGLGRQSWEPFCNAAGPAFDGNVTSLQIVGQTLYVGGEFQNGADIASADYLLACDLASGAASTTVTDPAHPFSGSVYALAADSDGTLYAGGGFTNLENIAAADNVAALPPGGGWQAMGAGGGPCGCAVTTSSAGSPPSGPTPTSARTRRRRGHRAGRPRRALERVGVERRGAGSGGADGWFPTAASINALAGTGTYLFATGTFQNAERRRAGRQRRVLRRHRTGTRSGPTAPATARGSATDSRSRSSIAGCTRPGASPAPAATRRRTRSPRSRSRRSSPTRRRR